MALVSLILCACATSAATDSAAVVPPDKMSPLGAYLVARHAQEESDYATAAGFKDRALVGDPENFDLMKRAFVFRVGEGDITEALPLATRIADLDRKSGFAQLVLVLEDVKGGHYDEAKTRVQTLPRDGAEHLAAPLIAAWADVGLQRPRRRC